MKAGGIRVLCVLAGWIVAGGCVTPDQAYFLETPSAANVYVVAGPSPIRKLAVLPFKAETELIGGSVSDMFVTELLRAGRYELVERSQMAKVLGESELALAGLSDARAAEVAGMLGAEGVLLGTVDEYGTSAYRGHPYPVAGISVRMIDCSNGRVMWSADLAKRADSKGAVLSSHARSVVHEMMAGLYRKWPQQAMSAPPAPGADPATVTAPVQPPEKPADFLLSDMGLREVTIGWEKPAARAREYLVERALSAKGPFQEAGRVPATRGSFTDKGAGKAALADATVYYYRLTAIGTDGQKSEPSSVRESMTAPPPEPPGGLKAEATAPRAVRLTWSPAPDDAKVRHYVVQRASAEASGEFVETGRTREPRYEEGGSADSPLKDSAAYRYRVYAVNAVEAAGEPCEPVAVTTRPPPAAVADVRATGGEVRCVPLAWAIHPEPEVTRYDVYRAEGGGEFRKIGGVKGRARVSFLDGGRNPGTLADKTEYRYQVRAVNTVEAEGGFSEAVAATTRPVPPAVTGVRAEGGLARRVRVTWEPSPDEKVTGYAIGSDGAATNMFFELGTVAGRMTVQFEDKGKSKRALGTLKDGADYGYKVLAYNAANARGEWSAEARAETKPAPVAPRGVSAVSELPHRIELTWAANAEPDTAFYVVESSQDGKKFRQLARIPAGGNGAVVQFVEEKLANGEARLYRVKMVDADGRESDWSETATGTSKRAPEAPSVLKAVGDGPTLMWEPSEAADVKGYTVWQKGFLRWAPLGTVERPEFSLAAALAGKKGLVVAVTAMDADGLESERSLPLEVASPGGEKK
ncbi:MAG: CsgG/HfaB family protein [Kiritimatiellia bacterium]